MTDLPTAAQPLTVLSEEERMFQDAVRDFAADAVRPLVRAMDEAGRLDPSLIPRCFELGLMGIEIPEALGGAGGTFFLAVLAVEALSRGGRRRRRSSWTCRTRSSTTACCAGAPTEQKARYLPEAGRGVGRRVRAVGGGRRLGRLRARHPRRAAGRRLGR